MQRSPLANLLNNRQNHAPGMRIPPCQIWAGLVLKTGVRGTGPWVRIPPPPPYQTSCEPVTLSLTWTVGELAKLEIEVTHGRYFCHAYG